uniref:Sel1 repeat family protein n=1 Tax=viral metagenome TaxID=1070528 RepID=A0A6C0BJC8_9ZZZZ
MNTDRIKIFVDQYLVGKYVSEFQWEPHEIHYVANYIAQVDTTAATRSLYGYMLLHGYGVPQNWVMATQCFTTASEGKFGDATYQLAIMASKGLGVPRNVGRAVILLKKAKKQHSVRAIHELANCYAMGIGKTVNVPKAIDLYIRAAREGCTESLNNLQYLFDQGLCTNEQLRRAINCRPHHHTVLWSKIHNFIIYRGNRHEQLIDHQ